MCGARRGRAASTPTWWKQWLPPWGQRAHVRRAHPAGLTAREVEVLGLLAQGLPNKQIASLLVVSNRTVGTHVAHIYEKIGVATRAGATLFALRHDLVETSVKRRM